MQNFHDQLKAINKKRTDGNPSGVITSAEKRIYKAYVKSIEGRTDGAKPTPIETWVKLYRWGLS